MLSKGLTACIVITGSAVKESTGQLVDIAACLKIGDMLDI